MKATNFDVRISRADAQRILFHGLHDKYGFDVMCKEYGDDDDWVGLSMDDLDEEDGSLDHDWETFEIYFGYHQDEAERQRIIGLLNLNEDDSAQPTTPDILENEDLFIQWVEINHGNHDNDTHGTSCEVYEALARYKAGTFDVVNVLHAVVDTEGYAEYRESWETFLNDNK